MATVKSLTLSASVMPMMTNGNSRIRIIPSDIKNAASECRLPTSFRSREYAGQLEQTSTNAQSNEDRNGSSSCRHPHSNASTTTASKPSLTPNFMGYYDVSAGFTPADVAGLG